MTTPNVSERVAAYEKRTAKPRKKVEPPRPAGPTPPVVPPISLTFSDEQRELAHTREQASRQQELRSLPWKIKASSTEDERAERNRALSDHLVASGRSAGRGSEAERGERGEESAARVLGQVEKGTQDAQRESGSTAPAAHAVSAHGPGSDQFGRLVHGRRAEEVDADRAAGALPAATTRLTGGVRDVEVPAYETTGKNPSNTAGSFTSNQAMLFLVNEAFSRADAFSRAMTPQAATAPGPPDPYAPSPADDVTFVTNVGGRGNEAVGENLTVRGLTEQRPSTPGSTAPAQGLAHDEMTRRYEAIEREDAFAGRFVLRPARSATGKRAGWQMQTAYPVSEGDAEWDAPRTSADLASSDLAAQSTVTARREDVKRIGLRITEIEKQIQAADGAVAAAEKALLGVAKGVDSGEKKVAAAEAKLAEAQVAEGVLDGAPGADSKNVAALKDALAKARESLAKVRSRVAELDAKIKTAQGDKVTQQQELARAQAAKVKAEKAQEDAEAQWAARNVDKPAGEGGAAAPLIQAGYNPATGHYDGERPAKPDNSIKGVDENGVELTAHHIYPWNKLRDQLNDALTTNDRAKLEALFVFGDVSFDKVLPGGYSESQFWDEFTKPAEQRSYQFSEVINRAAPLICWTPRNIFMGPKGELRGDDPGEDLDQALTLSGLPTPASATGELLQAGGGFGASGPATPDAAGGSGWDELRAQQWNAALAAGDRDEVETLLAYGEVNVTVLVHAHVSSEADESWFWDQLKLKPDQRDPGFETVTHAAARSICWAPAERTRRPGQRADPDGKRKLANLLMHNRRLGENAGPRPYRQTDWEAKDGKKVQKKGPRPNPFPAP